MKVIIDYLQGRYSSDLSEPLDISIPFGQARCFYAPPVMMQPYQSGDFIGSVKKGAPVNFYDVSLNPHGNGTHTECLGHITKKQESINQILKNYHFIAQLISVPLEDKNKADKIISLKSIKAKLGKTAPAAVIIRTLPNRKSKLTKDYSGTNPPYLDKAAMKYLVKLGVQHLLIDLPSVDREVDKGKLAAHHIFWGLEKNKKFDRRSCTITELVYVESKIKDGLYLLNLQLAPLHLDASPSRPVLYKLIKN